MDQKLNGAGHRGASSIQPETHGRDMPTAADTAAAWQFFR
jgi:hypothetical protein